MSDRPRTLCPACGQAIEPHETSVIEAVRLEPAPGFGAEGDVVEGLRAAFHPDCFPAGDPNWKRV